MRILILFLLLFPFLVSAQTDPMAFYTSDDPMEVLAAYRLIMGSKDEPGLAKKAVTSPAVGDPEAGQADQEGIFSPTIFDGPEAWSYIEVNGYVHPVIAGLIGRMLGWKQKMVLEVANFDRGYVWEEFLEMEDFDDALSGYSGPAILHRELGTLDPLLRLRKYGLRNQDLVFTRIPVPPLSARPRQALTGGRTGGGPENFCYRTLLYYAALYEFAEDQESRLMLDYYVQRYFNVLMALRKGEKISLLEQIPFAEASDPDWFSLPEDANGEDNIDPDATEVRFLSEDLYLIQKGGELSLFNLPNQVVIRKLKVPAGRLAGVNSSGTTALLISWDGFLQVDLKTGKLIRKQLNDMNYVTADAELESGIAYDWWHARALRLWLVPDFPIAEAYSQDGAYLFLEDKGGYGGIFSTKTGFPLAETSFEIPPDGWPGLHGAGKIDYGRGAAIGMHDGKWLIFRHNVLMADQGLAFTVDWKVDAAAFNQDGSVLLLVGEEKGCRLDLSQALKSGKLEDVKESCWEF